MTTTETKSTLDVTRVTDTWWKATIDNPPINMYDPDFESDLRRLVTELETDDAVKVVTFETANPSFFMAHIDLLKVADANTEPGPTGLPPWPDALMRLERAPVVSVGVLRGRARGVGSEFLLALDTCFASRETAILCQPEIGFGFFPGGGGLERLPLAVGRGRALEIILGAEDFDADTAERYGWINRSIPDAELDAFVTRFAERVSAFDKAAIVATKDIMNKRVQMAQGSDLTETQAKFHEIVAGPAVGGHVAKFLTKGGQQLGEFEENLAEHLPEM